MEAPFDPKSDKAEIRTPSPAPAPAPTLIEKNVGESSLSLGMEKESMREYWRREMMKAKSPLPPRQPKTTTTTSVLPPPPPPPPARSRVSLNLDKAVEHELIHGRHLDPGLDGKTIRRTISNRLSAQRSRMKKTQYLTDMEKKAQDLERLVASLTPKVEVYKEKKRLLQVENDSLRAQVDVREAQSKISQEGLEQRRREINELKEILRLKGLQLELQPPPTSLSEKIPISGPQEQPMQVEASGQGEPIMPVLEVPGLDEQTMPVEVSGPDEQAVQVSGQEEPSPKPYSIEFYQQRLMEMEMNQFIEHELNEGRRAGPSEPEIESMISMSFDGEEELEVDQYLNLDDDPDRG